VAIEHYVFSSLEHCWDTVSTRTLFRQFEFLTLIILGLVCIAVYFIDFLGETWFVMKMRQDHAWMVHCVPGSAGAHGRLA